MKKILKLGLVGCVVGILMSGCAGSYLNTSHSNNNVGDEYIYIKKDIATKKMHNLIMQAGKKNGWRMTEFKENEVIAENLSDKDEEAVTIYFTDKYFFTRPKNDDLIEAIQEALED